MLIARNYLALRVIQLFTRWKNKTREGGNGSRVILARSDARVNARATCASSKLDKHGVTGRCWV